MDREPRTGNVSEGGALLTEDDGGGGGGSIDVLGADSLGENTSALRKDLSLRVGEAARSTPVAASGLHGNFTRRL